MYLSAGLQAGKDRVSGKHGGFMSYIIHRAGNAGLLSTLQAKDIATGSIATLSRSFPVSD
jgi:carotenoid cleavage dioxygenase-like enzyme